MNRILSFPLLALTVFLTAQSASAQDDAKPNIILIFTDDQGYGDVGCYGAKGFKTPNIDEMAKEGIRFTSFYTGCSVCSGSRAALLTGRHYKRVGVPAVLFPGAKKGIPAYEITIAELLRRLGYTTTIIGKWHLGHLLPYLPTKNGFQSFYGIPYSNDMTIDRKNAKFAEDVVFRMGMTEDKARAKTIRNWVPLMRNDKVIEYPADQNTLTKRYTEEAVKFIGDNKDKTFFLYLPHTMPHVPMFVSKKFKGRTKTMFGDVMEELDWSVGEVLNAVKKNGIDKKTLVIFTCDNGTHRGSSGPLRGRKAGDYEGGYRVPCIMRWPGHIPAGAVCNETAATVDMVPTLAKIAGGKAPTDRIIDGKDIRDLMFAKPGAKTPHDAYVFLHRNGGVRSGKWKFYPWREGSKGRKKGKKKPQPKGPPTQLYDLDADLAETKNLAEKHPDVVQRLANVYRETVASLKKSKKK